MLPQSNQFSGSKFSTPSRKQPIKQRQSISNCKFPPPLSNNPISSTKSKSPTNEGQKSSNYRRTRKMILPQIWVFTILRRFSRKMVLLSTPCDTRAKQENGSEVGGGGFRKKNVGFPSHFTETAWCRKR